MIRKRPGYFPMWLALPVVIASLVAAASYPNFLRASMTAGADRGAAPGFVGSNTCGRCHAAELKGWKGSHHQLAMQSASDNAVLGDFANRQFHSSSLSAVFFRRGDRFMVRTAGPDGADHDYQVKYTFGVSPLQQYLIAMPGGRLQAFTVAWDSRPRSAGGHRLFALYSDSDHRKSISTRWTAIDQNWNSMCADCHSTNLRKNYDPSGHTYATTYSEVDVGCEACHGPGSLHLKWAAMPLGVRNSDPGRGLTIRLTPHSATRWPRDSHSGELLSIQNSNRHEIEVCARCHSRRSQIHEDFVHGQPLGDDYRVALLDDDLYFPDGQIKGEVYEYGSFIQSRMFHAGVRCSDCHDPHSARLRANGNDLCTRCHLREKYDSSSHHFHRLNSAGSRCVECHMPSRRYMVVDPRRDHSIRVPRPDLSARLGVPDACNECHSEKTPKWAADQLTRWYGVTPSAFQRFGNAIDAGRQQTPGFQTTLADLVHALDQPAIARASALELLNSENYADGTLLLETSHDESPLVRRAAAKMLSSSNSDATAVSLLNDPVRSVRIEAAESLASIANDPPPALVRALNRASAEYIAAQELSADRPEAHLNLSLFSEGKGNLGRTESELKQALELDPSFRPAAVNLADLYRELGRDREGEAVLQQARQYSPDDASLMYALALLKARERQNKEALALFAGAARSDPSNSRYAYVYAIALNDSGDTTTAIQILEHSVTLHPNDRDSIAALVLLSDHIGDQSRSAKYKRMLEQLK